MTLIAIFAFIAFSLGSFIWMVATWDSTLEEPVVLTLPHANNGGRA